MTFFALAPRLSPQRDQMAQRVSASVTDERARDVGVHVREAAALFGSTTGLATVITARRMRVVAGIGFDHDEIDRDISFCSHVVAQPHGLTCVLDATADPRFAGNPLVVGVPHIRFYVGAPLVSPCGTALGALCAIDTAPRAAITADQETRLLDLAERVTRRLLDD